MPGYLAQLVAGAVVGGDHRVKPRGMKRNFDQGVWARRKNPKRSACCQRKCCANYTSRAVLRFRVSCADRSQAERRLFARARVSPSVAGKKARQYLLETPFVVQAATGQLAAQPPPCNMNRVCGSFFTFATGVSATGLRYVHTGAPSDQPEASRRDAPVRVGVVAWLRDLMLYYQIQPDSRLVLLPFADKRYGIRRHAH